MTVQDLFSHTAGLTYGLFGNSMVKTAYNKASVFDLRITNAEMVDAGWLPFRSRISPAGCGITALPPTFSEESSKWFQDKHSSILPGGNLLTT